MAKFKVVGCYERGGSGAEMVLRLSEVADNDFPIVQLGKEYEVELAEVVEDGGGSG